MDGVLLVPARNGDQADFQDFLSQLRQEVADLRQDVACLHRENLGLRQRAGYWEAQHARCLERERLLQAQVEQLQADNRELRSQIFGRRSEKTSTKDRSNRLDGEETETSSPVQKRGQQPGRPGPIRRDRCRLPIREEHHELPADKQVCPQCQAPLVASGTEDSEQVEIEVKAFRRRIKRQRYQRTCTCQECPRTLTTPPPPKLISKGLLGVSVWVEILLAKFIDQQPLERQLRHWQLLGLDLAPGTVTGGLRTLMPLFKPLWELLRERNRLSAFQQADETRWLMFIDHPGKTGHTWWLWVFLGCDTVCFTLDPRRSHDIPEDHFREADRATLMVDRYSAYKAMSGVKDGRILLAFCWAHVRRDFVKVGKSWPRLKPWALAWLQRIRVLYRLQRQRSGRVANSSSRASVEADLREHTAAMRAQAEAELAAPSLAVPCRGALQSLVGHWCGLTRFLDDPRIPLDNNASERQHRKAVLGRKNYYGSGALWSGQLAAMLFSIFATLEKWKVNPRKWLTWYLQSYAVTGGQVPPAVAGYLPWNLSPEQRRSISDEMDDSS